MKRKYTVGQVLTHVNCSSSGHYTFEVTCSAGLCAYIPGLYYPLELPDMRTPRNDRQWRTWHAPKYVREEVERQIREGLAAGKFKFFEYDRDGNKRYNELRYHDLDMLKSMMGVITPQQP